MTVAAMIHNVHTMLEHKHYIILPVLFSIPTNIAKFLSMGLLSDLSVCTFLCPAF